MKIDFIEIPFLKLGLNKEMRTGVGFNSKDFLNEGIPLIKIGNIKNNKIDITQCSYIATEKKFEARTKEDDLLIAMRGATSGKLGLVSKKTEGCFYVGSIGNLGKINDNLIYKPFLKYIEEQLFTILKTEAKGTATPMVSIAMLKKFRIRIPSSKEQQKFLFELLEERKKTVNVITVEIAHQLDLVKQLRQAFLREAIQGKLVEQNPNDEPATELLAKIKAEKEQLIKDKKIKKQKPLPPISEEEIPFEIPKNWTWCRLGEITNYGRSHKADPRKFNENTWVLDLEDIEKETSRLLKKVRFNERNSLSTKSVFELGNVLYSKLRPYLDKVIVADENGVCTTEILPLKCFSNTNPYFLRYSLKRPDFISFVNSVTKGMKMPRLGTEEGRKALIPLPPLSEQKRIVAKLDELMKYCDGLEKSIKNSQTQNEMLLQQVLREALEPKDL